MNFCISFQSLLGGAFSWSPQLQRSVSQRPVCLGRSRSSGAMKPGEERAYSALKMSVLLVSSASKVHDG